MKIAYTTRKLTKKVWKEHYCILNTYIPTDPAARKGNERNHCKASILKFWNESPYELLY